jgi:hypothetical protein
VDDEITIRQAQAFYLVWRSGFNFTVCYVEVSTRRSPRNVPIAFIHAALTHYSGILFFIF